MVKKRWKYFKYYSLNKKMTSGWHEISSNFKHFIYRKKNKKLATAHVFTHANRNPLCEINTNRLWSQPLDKMKLRSHTHLPYHIFHIVRTQITPSKIQNPPFPHRTHQPSKTVYFDSWHNPRVFPLHKPFTLYKNKNTIQYFCLIQNTVLN